MEDHQAYSDRYELLEQLPNELISHIVSFASVHDLCALARVNRTFYDHCVRVLYASVSIPTYKQLGLFARNCVSREHFTGLPLFQPLSFVKGFRSEVHPVYSRVVVNDERVKHALTSLGHLEKLYLDYNEKFDGGDFRLSLPSRLSHSLTHCSIRFPAGILDFMWRLEDAKTLFQHPTLKVLTLQGGCSDDIMPSSLEIGTESTLLEELNLLDCIIGPIGLHQMLTYPRALRRLSITTLHKEPMFENERSRTITEYYEAISTTNACLTLTCLRMNLLFENWDIVPGAGIEKLVNLRYVELPPSHLYDIDDKASLDVYEWLLPTNLELLKISPGCCDFPDFSLNMAEKQILAPNLRRVVMCYGYESLQPQDNFPAEGLWVRDSPRLSEMIAAGRNAGVEVQTIYEDFSLWLKHNEPSPPVWEIPNQIC